MNQGWDVNDVAGQIAMAGKIGKLKAMDCRGKSPGWLDRFFARSGTDQKSRNVENRDIGFVNESCKEKQSELAKRSREESRIRRHSSCFRRLFSLRVAGWSELWRLRHSCRQYEPLQQFRRSSFDGDVTQYFDSIEHSLLDCSDGWKNIRKFPKE